LYGTRLPWPAPWEEIFGREAPLLIEIGFGGGQFLVHLARKRPECNILGVEISAPSLRQGEKQIRRSGLNFIRLVQGDARLALQALCKPGTVGGIYVNFPDPWPKASHASRRLITDHFLCLVATRLSAGGELEIATDHEEYASAIADCLERSPFLASAIGTPFTKEDDGRLRTKYEMSALEESRRCRYFKWRRNQIPAPNAFHLPTEFPMPHVILRTTLAPQDIASRFKAFQVTDGGARVRFIGCCLSGNKNLLLIDTYVNEEPLDQRIGLAVRRRRSGDLLLKLHDLGFPRATMGIHLAIKHLARWLTELNPAIVPVKSNLAVSLDGNSQDR